MSADRIIGLDMIRTIAITIVVIFHSVPILYPLITLPHIGAFFHKLFALTEPFGILGVELFFVLSGFLIGSILIKIYIRSEQFGPSEIRFFLVRRWFRTLPNYWLILVIDILLYSWLHLQDFGMGYARYFFFVQNLWYRHPEFFPEAWSLAVEEWFYLTLPATLLVISFCCKKWQKQHRILLTFIVYATVFFLARILFTDNRITDPLYFDGRVRKIVFFRLDAISYGLLVAYLNIYHKPRLQQAARTLLYTGITGVVVITAIHYAGINPQWAFYAKSHAYRVFHNTILLTLIPLFFSMCIPYASQVKKLGSKTWSVVITTISKISYSMYLVHFSLIFLPFWRLIHYTVYNCIPVYIAYWGAVIGISWLLYHFYELPVMNLRTKISRPDPAV